MLSFTPPWRTAVFLARIVMPFSRSRSIESMTRSLTSWLARKAPDCQSMASTRVVLPWSTWATMATLRRSARATVIRPEDRIGPRMAAGPGTGLLERDAELAAVARLLAAAEGAAGAAMRVEGPPGIGKSRLLAAARGAADHAGLRVLSARASDLERDFRFGVVRQLFEPVLARAGADERAALLGGAAALAATVLELPGPGGGDAGEEATPAALHGLYWLCAGLAEQRPLLLCVDDLQWGTA